MRKFFSLILLCVSLFLCFGFKNVEKVTALSSDEVFFVGNMEINQEIESCNKRKRVQIASLTKMVTALVVFEKVESGELNLNQKFKISKNASEVEPSKLGMKENEEYTLENLLNAMLIKSANDCAIAIAENISGNEKEFVKLMNLKCLDLGLRNTYFENSTGLASPNQFSTAEDVYSIARELFSNEKYLEIAKKKMAKIVSCDGTETTIYATNQLLKNGIIGKTGYTPEAGYCFCGMSENNNVKLISVTLGKDTSENRFSDATKHFEQCFKTYEKVQVCNKNSGEKIKLKLGKNSYVLGFPEEDFYVLKSKNDDRVLVNKHLFSVVYAPIKKGEKIGEIAVVINGKIAKNVNIVTNCNYSRISIFDATKKIIKNSHFSWNY